MTKVPKRGDLVYVNFTPQSGHEQAGIRPAIVLSGEKFNEVTGFAVVCPITRQQKHYPFEVPLPEGSAIEGVILTDQVKSLDWKARKFSIKDKAPASTVNECLDMVHTILS